MCGNCPVVCVWCVKFRRKNLIKQKREIINDKEKNMTKKEFIKYLRFSPAPVIKSKGNLEYWKSLFELYDEAIHAKRIFHLDIEAMLEIYNDAEEIGQEIIRFDLPRILKVGFLVKKKNYNVPGYHFIHHLIDVEHIL